MEIWKDIKGYKGIYQVSNLGMVKVLKRKVPHWRGGHSLRKESIKTGFHAKGYLVMPLSKDGTEVKISVHRLVAEAFIPNPENKPQVNHKNGIKTDNRVENLEWVTPSENIIHADKNHLRNLKGINNSGSRLSETQVLEIRSIGKSKTLAEIADMYEVSFQCVSKILNRKTWKHL